MEGGRSKIAARHGRGCSFYLWSTVFLLLLIGLPVLYVRYTDPSDPPAPKNQAVYRQQEQPRAATGSTSATGARFPADQLKAGWTRFENCRHIAGEYYDGDSFMAETADGKRVVFRLYFVDAPETDDRFPKRNAEQAKVFGVKDVRPLGEQAREFTRNFLRRGFTATTKHQHAAGMSGLPRSYAFVEVEGELLSEALLKAGLGRAYGRDTALPDGGDKYKHWDRLNGMATFVGRE